MMTTAHRMIIAATVASMIFAATARGDGRSVSANVPVTAVVIPNCRIFLNGLNFGTYDPLATNLSSSADAAAVVTVSCTRNAQVAIEMDQGQNAPESSSSRLLMAGGDQLAYQIYRDPARTQVWGRGPEAMHFVSRGVSLSEQISVYGRIPPGQDVPAGTYNDMVTATVDF